MKKVLSFLLIATMIFSLCAINVSAATTQRTLTISIADSTGAALPDTDADGIVELTAGQAVVVTLTLDNLLNVAGMEWQPITDDAYFVVDDGKTPDGFSSYPNWLDSTFYANSKDAAGYFANVFTNRVYTTKAGVQTGKTALYMGANGATPAFDASSMGFGSENWTNVVVGKVKYTVAADLSAVEGTTTTIDLFESVIACGNPAQTGIYSYAPLTVEVLGEEPVPTTYKVYTVVDGGAATEIADVAEGSAIEIPAAPEAATGYDFDGWYSDAAYETKVETAPTMGAADYTFYGRFVKEKYAVVIGDAAAVEYEYGDEIAEPAAPEAATGYEFAGWYIDAAYETAATFPITVTGSVTLYAKFVETPPAPTLPVLTAADVAVEDAVAGDTFSVVVKAENVDGIDGIDFDLTYDETKFTATGVTVPFTTDNSSVATAGTVEVVAVGGEIAADGTVATITFEVVDASDATSNMAIENATWSVTGVEAYDRSFDSVADAIVITVTEATVIPDVEPTVADAAIAGIPVVGEELTASATITEGTGAYAGLETVYTWYADGVAIDGATAAAYTVAAADAGKVITVKVAVGDANDTSDATEAVIIRGDVNENGKIDIADGALAFKLASDATYTVQGLPGVRGLEAADVDNSGAIDGADVSAILAALLAD